MSDTESSKIEQDEEQDLLEQRWWRNALSASWLFTYALIIVQSVTVPFAWNTTRPRLIVFVFLAANLSLAAIVPIWWVVIRRLVFVVVGIAVLLANGLVLFSVSLRGDLLMFLLPILIGGTVAIPLLGISWFLGHFGKPSVDGEMVQFQEGLRFGIHHLFIASAVVAVLCGIGKGLAPYFLGSLNKPSYLFGVITITVSFNTLMSTWALMGRSIGWRLLIALSLAVLSCVGSSCAFQSPVVPLISFMFGLCWVATTVHLALLRRSGLRFIKKQPNPKLARSL